MPRAKSKIQKSAPKKNSAKVADPLLSPSQNAIRFKSLDLRWALRIAVAVVLIGIYWAHQHRPQASSSPAPVVQSVSPIPAEWGQALESEKLASYSAPPETMDFLVDAKGNAYFLAANQLFLYVAGKVSKTAMIHLGPNRSLSSDGKSLFLTNSDYSVLSIFNLSLEPTKDVEIKGAERLLGLTWSPKQGVLITSNASNQNFFLLSPSGKVLSRHAGTVQQAPWGWVNEIAADATGRFVIMDIYSNSFALYSPQAKLLRKSDGQLDFNNANIRVAFHHDDLYVPIVNRNAVLVLEPEQMRFKGYLKVDGARYARVGGDGFLYIFTGNKVLKFKPL